ncbi:hypothetical protein IVA87_33795 [Bradyrhizobium sp. 147]|uniref:hypothetical protein n=1 Tax=Bradyrhizobium sp. 147 TaxID=2782623 RepID=UPI001FF76682|nr:hypothetical protein [Bradyrhizobium sp. 147]MCK1684229.1 hypothetical protein [Bradyrhizobium sp. 147]
MSLLRRLARAFAIGLGLVLIAPILAVYGLWLAGGRLADILEQRGMRRRRRDRD